MRRSPGPNPGVCLLRRSDGIPYIETSVSVTCSVGSCLPASQFLTVWGETLTRAATACWVKPALMRAARSRPPRALSAARFAADATFRLLVSMITSLLSNKMGDSHHGMRSPRSVVQVPLLPCSNFLALCGDCGAIPPRGSPVWRCTLSWALKAPSCDLRRDLSICRDRVKTLNLEGVVTRHGRMNCAPARCG